MTLYNGPMQAADSLAKKLAPILEPLEAGLARMHYRVVPSAFNPNDPYLRALPLAREWRWPTCEEHLKRFSPRTLILQLPSFWQVEPFVHAAARAAQVPVCPIEPQNYPLDRAAVRLASANAILAEAGEAAAVAEHLHAGRAGLPPYWMLVHAGDAPQWRTPDILRGRGLEVAQEVHLAPGVPLLVQCAAIVDKQNDYYHLFELFNWSDDLSNPTITSAGALPFSLTGFALSFSLIDKGACACGKRLVARAS